MAMRRLFYFIVLTGLWTGCSPRPEKKSDSKITDPGLRLGMPEKKKPMLYVLTPAGHFPLWFQEIVAEKTTATVTVETYATLAEARSKLEQEKPPYDVVAISERLIPELVQAGKLAKLTPEKFQGLPGIDPKFLHHYFDRDNAYARPYAGSFLGVLVRGNAKPPKTWEEAIATGVSRQGWALSDVEVALGLHGVAESSPTNTPPTVEWGALDQLQQQAGTDGPVQLVVPAKRTAVILYHVAIPAGAPHPDFGYEWIRQLFTTENAVRLAEENYWTVTQPAVQKRLSPGRLKEGLLYPPAIFLDQAVFVKSVMTNPPPAAVTSPH